MMRARRVRTRSLEELNTIAKPAGDRDRSVSTYCYAPGKTELPRPNTFSLGERHDMSATKAKDLNTVVSAVSH